MTETYVTYVKHRGKIQGELVILIMIFIILLGLKFLNF